MKKITSLLLVLAIVFALVIPACAEETPHVAANQAQGGIVPIDLSDVDLSALLGGNESASAEMRREEIAALGGVPGQVNVMLGDKCVSFAHAAPELHEGRTMVPLRAVFEDMGATVSYEQETRTAIVESDTISFSHVIGSDVIRLSDGTEINMDVHSYIADGSTMVPVRFFSQALGYEVNWDDDYRMVFLTDRESFIKEADAHFTVYNKFLADSMKRLDLSETCKGNSSLDPAITVSEGGSVQDYRFSGALELLANKTGLHAKITADVKDVLKLLEWLDTGEISALLGELSLDEIFVELIISGAKIYLSCPAIFEAINAEARANGETTMIATDTWLAIDTGAMTYADMIERFYADIDLMSSMTLGSLVYELSDAVADESHYFGAVQTRDAVLKVLDMLVGDDVFAKNGSTYKLSMDLERLAELVTELTGMECTAGELREGGIQTFHIETAIAESGSASVTAKVSAEYDGIALLLDCAVSGSANSAAGTVVFDFCDAAAGDGIKLTVDFKETAGTTSEVIQSAPPAGKQIIDLGGSGLFE